MFIKSIKLWRIGLIRTQKIEHRDRLFYDTLEEIVKQKSAQDPERREDKKANAAESRIEKQIERRPKRIFFGGFPKIFRVVKK
jgi:hypothetical protein